MGKPSREFLETIMAEAWHSDCSRSPTPVPQCVTGRSPTSNSAPPNWNTSGDDDRPILRIKEAN
jgi:hypothetical protein